MFEQLRLRVADQPAYETDLLYLACLATLVLAGSGPFSIDAIMTRRAQSRAAVSSV
jgi:putative oxidoreductase